MGAMPILKEQMKNPMFVTKGGVGYGVDETAKVVDDGKGWVWIAAEMSPGGLAIELFKSVPFGKRALFVAKANNVDEMFEKINWDIMDKRIDTTLGGPQVKQRWAELYSALLPSDATRLVDAPIAGFRL